MGVCASVWARYCVVELDSVMMMVMGVSLFDEDS